MRILTAALLCLIVAAPLRGQKEKPEPLTEAQQEQIAEAGIDPVARVDLYVKFLNQRSGTIQGLIKRAKSPARSSGLDHELQNFSSLMDELSANLDVYSDRKADVRKSLKPLNEAIQRWQAILNGLHSEPGFDLELKDAIDSSKDLADQARQITTDQETYFKAHPDEKGQDRAEPK